MGSAHTGPLSRIDARAKIAALIVLTVVVLHARGVLLALCCAVCAAAALAVRLAGRDIARSIAPLAAILAITVLAQVLYDQQGTVLAEIAGIRITREALAASAVMVIRLVCIMVLSVAFMRCTRTVELICALTWFTSPLSRLGIRADAFALSLGIALNFVPVLFDEFGVMKKAQMARLADFEGAGLRARLAAYRTLFAPLARSALRHADTLACALITRCF